MNYFSNLISAILAKNPNRDKVTSLADRSSEKPVESRLTTAPGEFDIFPSNYGRSTIEMPTVQSGYYYEVRDAWQMYANDDRVRSTIDSIADDATQVNRNGFPFGVSVKLQNGNTNAKTEELAGYIHNELKRLEIYKRSSDMIKFALLEGSRFYRIVTDTQASQVTELRHIKGPRNGYIMVRLEEEPFTGFYTQFDFSSQKIVAAFWPWEVLRFDWNLPDESAYGMGLFSSSRPNWKRLDKTESDLYIARKTRAYARTNREYPGATIEQLKELKADHDNAVKKAGPMSIESDIFTTGKASVLDTSNAAIYSIEDVEYAQRKLFASGRRPVSLLGGYGKDAVNRAVLDRQEHRYISGFLSGVTEMFDSAMKPLLNIMLLVGDYYAPDYQISFEWTKKSVEDKKAMAEIIRDGVDRKAVPLSLYAMLFDLDPKGIQKEIEEDQARLAEWEEKYGPKFENPGFVAPEGNKQTKIGE